MTGKLKGSTQLFFSGGSLAGASLISKALDLIRGSVFLKVFSPSEYGLIDLVNQIISLSKYADLGLLNNVLREYNYDAKHDVEMANKNKHASYGLDLGLSLIVFIGLMITSIYIDESIIIKLGVFFGGVAFFALKGLKIINLEFFLAEKYAELSKFILVKDLCLNLILIASVFILGVYSPIVLKPIVLAIAFIIGYYFFPFKITFSFLKIRSKLKFGLLFSGLSILFGLWIFFERYIITHFFSLNEVGLYAACLFILKLGTSVLDELIKPFTLKVRESLAESSNESVVKYVIFPSIVFYFLSIVIVYVSQDLMHYLESNILNHFVGISSAFEVLSWLIPTYAIGSLSGYLLFAKGVDRFKQTYVVYIFRFLLMFLLTFGKPPKDILQLFAYFIVVEYFFFYAKQYLIYSKLFSNRKALILLFFLVGQIIMILNNEKTYHFLF